MGSLLTGGVSSTITEAVDSHWSRYACLFVATLEAVNSYQWRKWCHLMNEMLSFVGFNAVTSRLRASYKSSTVICRLAITSVSIEGRNETKAYICCVASLIGVSTSLLWFWCCQEETCDYRQHISLGVWWTNLGLTRPECSCMLSYQLQPSCCKSYIRCEALVLRWKQNPQYLGSITTFYGYMNAKYLLKVSGSLCSTVLVEITLCMCLQRFMCHQSGRLATDTGIRALPCECQCAANS